MAVYILLGPEEGEKIEFVEAEKKRISSAHPDAEFYTFFVGDDKGEAIYAALSQPSFFSTFRFVVIKAYENAKKTDDIANALSLFAETPQDDVELIILSSETSTSNFPKEILSLAGKERTKIYWELKEQDKINWIYNYVRSEGFTITKGAVDEILSAVDNNTLEMKNLISSITLFLHLQKSGNTIDEDVIETYTARTRGENGYTLFRAIAERNLENALLIVNSIILQSNVLIPTFTTLQNQFRRLEACQIAKKNGMSDYNIPKEVDYVPLYPQLRPTKGINFKEWPVFQSAMRNYTLEDTERIILYLGKLDSEIKSTNTDLMKLGAEEIIYSIIVEKGVDSKLTLDPPSLSLNI